MSHFSVAVISESVLDIERLMAPYQENNMGDCPKEFLEFHNTEDEERPRYENESVKKIKTPDGRLLAPWDNEFRVPSEIGIGANTHRIPEGMGYEEVEVMFKDLYPTFDDFMKDWNGSNGPDPETGFYGYWENPNKKWDYWRIGGRWRGKLKARSGVLGDLTWEHTIDGQQHHDTEGHFDCVQIKDLDLSIDTSRYQRAIRFWEVNVEGQELTPEENPDDFRSFWKPQYYTDKFGEKETYAKSESLHCIWALVTPDGKWYEQGDMGWFGTSDATESTTKAYIEFFEKSLNEANPEHFITVLDCHI